MLSSASCSLRPANSWNSRISAASVRATRRVYCARWEAGARLEVAATQVRRSRDSTGGSPMRLYTWLVTALALLTTLGTLSMVLATSARSGQPDDLRALDGEWIYIEDKTEGRALEQLGPPMASKFSMRIEEGAVVLDGH